MGFFQDLKQDLSQAVNELDDEAVINGMNLDDTAGLNNIASSSEDLFGTNDDDFADLEAMLEREVEALGNEPQPEAAVETQPEPEPELIDETVPEPEAEVQAEPESVSEPEVLEEQTLQAEEEPHDDETAEAENINMKSEENNMEMEQLLNEVEQNVEESTLMDAPVEQEAPQMSEVAVSTDTAIITEGMNITGDVNSSGNMDLLGSITGNIDILGKLNVTGSVTGNSSAAEIYAESAQINGEIKSKGSVKIGQSSVVIGNIFATSAVIAGAVKGDIDVHGPVILDTSAIVMGNIKSKSVQINNGAVIEGMCSQCYAEISPTSFFNDIKKNRK